ncbi:hypothetical protein ETD86_26010 [Nonomuraea turkmeniaca]|uniref:Uncharacterized protein n=1 Tax=Nonomuraea turkmeniaca TaxID=103838 RepID=A0A5S4FCL5_9ACTN|nr:hypothetical protein ETD86_26010 [Nonomuraea turkmeniaca]
MQRLVLGGEVGLPGVGDEVFGVVDRHELGHRAVLGVGSVKERVDLGLPGPVRVGIRHRRPLLIIR